MSPNMIQRNELTSDDLITYWRSCGVLFDSRTRLVTVPLFFFLPVIKKHLIKVMYKVLLTLLDQISYLSYYYYYSTTCY